MPKPLHSSVRIHPICMNARARLIKDQRSVVNFYSDNLLFYSFETTFHAALNVRASWSRDVCACQMSDRIKEKKNYTL